MANYIVFGEQHILGGPGDIQVGMGMSYSITRSGNLHSNALKSAHIFPLWPATVFQAHNSLD